MKSGGIRKGRLVASILHSVATTRDGLYISTVMSRRGASGWAMDYVDRWFGEPTRDCTAVFSSCCSIFPNASAVVMVKTNLLNFASIVR